MRVQKDQRGRCAATCRALHRAFCLAFAMGACGIGMYVSPGHAAEPLDCSLPFSEIDIHDARFVPGGTFCQAGTVDIYSDGELENAGDLLAVGGMTIHAGGSLGNALSGSLMNVAPLVNDGLLHNSGTLENHGALENSNRLVNLGALTSFGSVSNAGDFLQSGAFNNFGQAFNSGTLINHGGGLLMNYSHLYNSGSLQNLDSAMLVNQGILDNYGTVLSQGAAMENRGQLNNLSSLTNRLGTLLNAGDIYNIGTLKNQYGGTLKNFGRVLNFGVLTSETGSLFTNFGSVSNLGRLTNGADSTLTNYYSLSNVGRLTNEARGVLVNHGMVTNKVVGKLANRGTLTNAAGGTLENHGTLTNDVGAALANQGTLTNYASLSNRGALTNHASLSNQGTLINLGTLTNTMGGTLENKAVLRNRNGARFVNLGVLRNDGVITNAGSLVSTGAVYGSGSYLQTAGSTTIDGGFTQHQINIDGGALVGNGWIASSNVMRIAAGALLAPGDEPGDVGEIAIEAPLNLFGSLEIDIDTLARFDFVTVGDDVAFSPVGSTWFNFYLGNDASQGEGDTFNFFNALTFFNFDALNFRCHGLMSGLGCELNLINDGTGLQLALNAEPGDGTRPVPEPGSLGIMCMGLMLLGGGLGWRTSRGRAAGRRAGC